MFLSRMFRVDVRSGPRFVRGVASAAIVPTQPHILPGESMPRPEHAVISTFDLFSIGIGPSSSHTVGPMRAGKIFVEDLRGLNLLHRVESLKITLYGSLAATGKGHMTPEAVIMGLESSDPETIETSTVSSRYDNIVQAKHMMLGGNDGKRIRFDMIKDMGWRLDPLPEHPNGMRFSVFDDQGDLLATNQYFSVGGGFVVNNETQTTENVYYRNIIKSDAEPSRRDQMHGEQLGVDLIEPPSASEARNDEVEAPPSTKPPFLFRDAATLLALTKEHNLTIAQIVWENELAFRDAAEIKEGLLKLWQVMDECIRSGVTSTEAILPGGLNVKRRAPGLYRRLQRGFYPSNLLESGSTPGLTPKSKLAEINRLAIGRKEHDLKPVPLRVAPVFPGIEYLSAMAIAVNEVNASGGRVVTAPTNGAAGVIPATLKYVTEFLSEDMERDVMTFLLTASAIGMLFKRGATISAADGGCMSEVGVACSMAAGGLAACLGASPSVISQAAEIGIEHNLGLSCDPVLGLVQVPCIERNSLGAVKAVTAAQLAMAGDGIHTVSLDDAIEAVRTTARDMHSHYKETSLAGLATTVKIPLSSPAC